jgi:hypothetical protein
MINSRISTRCGRRSATASLVRLVGVANLLGHDELRQPVMPLGNSVKAAHVHYAYLPDHPVLHNVDLNIGPT